MHYLHFIFCLFLFLSSIMVALSVNTIEAVLFLILVFFNAGILLILLNIEFLGLIFIIIYVGAIAVLFLFIVMMLNIKIKETFIKQFLYENINGILLLAIVIYVFFCSAIIAYKDVYNNDFILNGKSEYIFFIDHFNNIDIIGQVLYNYYILYVLFAGIILLIALIGPIALTLRSNRIYRYQNINKQLSRTQNFLSFFG